MPAVKANLVRVNVTTIGTGLTLAIGTTVANFRPLSVLPDGATVNYALSDTAGNETGYGVIGGGGTTLTRNFIDSSTGSVLALSGGAQLVVTDLARDFTEQSLFAHSYLGGV